MLPTLFLSFFASNLFLPILDWLVFKNFVQPWTIVVALWSGGTLVGFIQVERSTAKSGEDSKKLKQVLKSKPPRLKNVSKNPFSIMCFGRVDFLWVWA